jgi:hypothetical protein
MDYICIHPVAIIGSVSSASKTLFTRYTVLQFTHARDEWPEGDIDGILRVETSLHNISNHGSMRLILEIKLIISRSSLSSWIIFSKIIMISTVCTYILLLLVLTYVEKKRGICRADQPS